MKHEVWDEITRPFPNFNDATVEVWERISYFIPHFTRRVVTGPCLNCSQFMWVQGAPAQMTDILLSLSLNIQSASTHLLSNAHTCFNESGRPWFRQWLVAYSAPSHYLNQYWVIINWTLRNDLQWNYNHNAKLFSHENAFEIIVCEIAAICPGGDELTQHWLKVMARQWTIASCIVLRAFHLLLVVFAELGVGKHF